MVEKRAREGFPLTDGASLEVRSTPLSATLEAILVGLLIVLTIVCYGNMLTNSFVYDDQQQILQNPYIKSLEVPTRDIELDRLVFRGRSRRHQLLPSAHDLEFSSFCGRFLAQSRLASIFSASSYISLLF